MNPRTALLTLTVIAACSSTPDASPSTAPFTPDTTRAGHNSLRLVVDQTCSGPMTMTVYLAGLAQPLETLDRNQRSAITYPLVVGVYPITVTGQRGDTLRTWGPQIFHVSNDPPAAFELTLTCT